MQSDPRKGRKTNGGMCHGRASFDVRLGQTATNAFAITRKTVTYAERERSHSNLCVEARSRCDVQIHGVSKV